MKLFKPAQLSPEWWDLKVGKISGTRFGQVISKNKNRLVYEMMNEIISGQCDMSIFVTDDMQYGIDNESLALELYSEQSGIKVERVGAILSDFFDIHIASPDGVNVAAGIAHEVKCTRHGEIHLERYFEGVDSKYLPQCINYFVVSPEIKEVHFISYCGLRPEKPVFWKVLKREDYLPQIKSGFAMIPEIEAELNEKLEQYKF
jgi:hypothetical protein